MFLINCLRTRNAYLLLALGAADLSANDVLSNMAADTWMSVPNSQMSAVCFRPAPKEMSCKYVIEAWNGGVYDQANRKMLVWGGGHADYYGNEVYAFNTETLKWERLTDPSTGLIEGVDPLPDGMPVSRHTYDGLAYISTRGKMFAFGGAMAGAGNGSFVTWYFDAFGKKWENRNPAGPIPGGKECCEFTAEFDPVSRKVFLQDDLALWAYDIDQNSWKSVMERSKWGDPRKSTVDPKRHILFTIGSGEFQAYSIDKGKDVTSEWTTTGGATPIGGYGPAMDYDWNADKLVAWTGGGPWVLNMETKAWTRMSGTGAPAAGAVNGTYGRFRYLEKENVFILVNSVDDNVYFYKLTAGPGSQRTTVSVEPPRGKSRQGGIPGRKGFSNPPGGGKLRDMRGAEVAPGDAKRESKASGAFVATPSRGSEVSGARPRLLIRAE